MDKDYFNSLKNTVQDSERPTSNSSNILGKAFLTVKIDVDCKLYCDGDFLDLFEANKVKKIPIETGQHLMTVESEHCDGVSEDHVIDAAEAGKNYLLMIKDMKEKEDSFIQKQEDAKLRQKEEEAERKKQEKELQERNEIINNTQDIVQKGKELYETRDYDSAKAILMKVIEVKENAEAFLYLGYCHNGYFLNKGFSGFWSIEDLKEAVKWIRKSADLGNSEAKFALGECYSKGKGVQKDEDEAIKWWKASAEQGFAIAQYHLGEYYGDCDDMEESLRWFTLAAEQGHEPSQLRLVSIYLNCMSEYEDVSLALKWLRATASKGNETSKIRYSGWESLYHRYDYDTAYDLFKREGLNDDIDFLKEMVATYEDTDVAIRWFAKIGDNNRIEELEAADKMWANSKYRPASCGWPF